LKFAGGRLARPLTSDCMTKEWEKEIEEEKRLGGR
jgi:hypothetical protein